MYVVAIIGICQMKVFYRFSKNGDCYLIGWRKKGFFSVLQRLNGLLGHAYYTIRLKIVWSVIIKRSIYIEMTFSLSTGFRKNDFFFKKPCNVHLIHSVKKRTKRYQCMSIVRIAESPFKQISVLLWKCCIYFYILVHQIW